MVDQQQDGPRAPRKLVVCLDGTNDEIGRGRPSNVAKVFEMLDLDHPDEQLAYYDPGVGTLPSSNTRGKIARAADVLAGLAVGYGLRANVSQAYTWLMNNYRPGDRVYVFGFSRGAFTARALVSMLECPGLLRSGSDNLIDYAVQNYASRAKLQGNAPDGIRAFADSFCWGTFTDPMSVKPPDDKSDGMDLDAATRIHAVPVEYLGIWDTVYAGFVLPDRTGDALRKWSGIRTLGNVRQLRHAVSMDDRRLPYRPVLVEPRDEFREAWFAGVHSDVGGTFENCQLAMISLKWVFDPVAAELRLRDQDKNPLGAYQNYCGVTENFATGPVNQNGSVWKLAGVRSRESDMPHTMYVHPSVLKRRQADPSYWPQLAGHHLLTYAEDEKWWDPVFEQATTFGKTAWDANKLPKVAKDAGQVAPTP